MAPMNRKPKIVTRRVFAQLPLDPVARRQWRRVQRVLVTIIGLFFAWNLYKIGFWIYHKFPAYTELSAPEKARMQEVADHMLDIYNTLAEMRYIEPDSIIPGPHNITYNQDIYDSWELDPLIVYLYSVLPYVDQQRVGRRPFFHGGGFADFRDRGQVRNGRDPFGRRPQGSNFYAENGPYMRTWMTPLSMPGYSSGCGILYDARNHKIWLLEPTIYGWNNLDLAFKNSYERPSQNPNGNYVEHELSRGAIDVLRDIKRWHRQLKVVPGYDLDPWYHNFNPLPGTEIEMPEDEGRDMEELYRKHGWPNNFNGDNFEADQVRHFCANSAREYARKTMEQLESDEYLTASVEGNVNYLNERISAAKSPDEEWNLRFDLWQHERELRSHVFRAPENKKVVEEQCGDGDCQRTEDMPLWELECLKEQYAKKRTTLAELKQYIPYEKDADIVRAKKAVRIHDIALRASQADADRLRPGAKLGIPQKHDAEGDIDERIRLKQEEAREIREFLAMVPVSAEKTRTLVENAAKRVAWQIEYFEKQKGIQLEIEQEDRDREEHIEMLKWF